MIARPESDTIEQRTSSSVPSDRTETIFISLNKIFLFCLFSFLLMHSSWESDEHKLRWCRIYEEFPFMMMVPDTTFNVHTRTIKRETKSVKIIQRKIISVIEFSGQIQRRKTKKFEKHKNIFLLHNSPAVLNRFHLMIFSHFSRKENILFPPEGFFLEHIQVCTFEPIWSIWP